MSSAGLSPLAASASRRSARRARGSDEVRSAGQRRRLLPSRRRERADRAAARPHRPAAPPARHSRWQLQRGIGAELGRDALLQSGGREREQFAEQQLGRARVLFKALIIGEGHPPTAAGIRLPAPATFPRRAEHRISPSRVHALPVAQSGAQQASVQPADRAHPARTSLHGAEVVPRRVLSTLDTAYARRAHGVEQPAPVRFGKTTTR